MRVHLITAGDFHDMDFARLEVLKLLSEFPFARTSTASGYGDLNALGRSDLLVTYTCNLAPTASETAALRSFLSKGGRWIALHGVGAILDFLGDGRIAAAAGHDEFMDLLGVRFLAHPPIGAFRVEVTREQSDLTDGLSDFDVIDELYLFERRADLRVLLQTRFSGSCAPFVVNEWRDEVAPVLYLHTVGEGQVLYLSLGHCRGHYDPSPNGAFITHPQRCAWNYPVYYELLRRSLRWGLRVVT